jgi:hypothetical protein
MPSAIHGPDRPGRRGVYHAGTSLALARGAASVMTVARRSSPQIGLPGIGPLGRAAVGGCSPLRVKGLL